MLCLLYGLLTNMFIINTSRFYGPKQYAIIFSAINWSDDDVSFAYENSKPNKRKCYLIFVNYCSTRVIYSNKREFLRTISLFAVQHLFKQVFIIFICKVRTIIYL